MIAQGGVGAVLETAPGLAVAVVKFGGVAMFVGEVAGREHLARDFFDELGGGFGSGQGRAAASDVACADERKYCIFSRLRVAWRAGRCRGAQRRPDSPVPSPRRRPRVRL